MFRNYLKIALRNIVRQKFYSMINIMGLAIGIGCFIMIGLWIKDELSFDKSFKNADRIYRIANDLVTNNVPSHMSQADPRIADHIREDYPEIESVTRMIDFPTLLTYNTTHVFENKAYFVDSSFFRIFSYEFIQGDAEAFKQKNAIVITESIAKRLFGNESPIGKTIFVSNERIRNAENRKTRIITGVIKDSYANAHFYPKVMMVKFGNVDMFEYTYALFKRGYDPKRFEENVWPEINNKWFKEEYAKDAQALTLTLQPLERIHLNSHLLWEHEPTGNMQTVYACSIIAFFILLIAAINYMNLATAKFYDRSREVGVRKIIGATRKQIIAQFLTEAVALAFLALLLSLALVEMSLPLINHFSGKKLTLNLLDPAIALAIIMLTFGVGIVSGLYPAFFVSAVAPIQALKQAANSRRSKATPRKVLVVVQFAFSISMLIATMVVTRQLDFAKKADLGFNNEQVLQVTLTDALASNKTEELKAELLEHPSIKNVSASHNMPGDELYHFYHKFEMADGSLRAKLIPTMLVDYDYQTVLALKLTAGKSFDTAMAANLDSGLYAILNESAVKMLGWKDPIGKKITTGNSGGMKKGYCVGVVKDFHTESLHEPIKPLLFRLTKKQFKFLSIKILPWNMKETIAFIENKMKAFSPGYPFQYAYLNDAFNRQYEREEKQSIMFKWLAGLCIFISCLGLMGLTSFTTGKRNKEISIRKIAGAQMSDILLLLMKDFMKPIIISLVVAIPVSWYLMRQWLNIFAYHIELHWTLFFTAGSAAVLIAILTISVHTFKAANQNPATVLKYE